MVVEVALHRDVISKKDYLLIGLNLLVFPAISQVFQFNVFITYPLLHYTITNVGPQHSREKSDIYPYK